MDMIENSTYSYSLMIAKVEIPSFFAEKTFISLVRQQIEKSKYSTVLWLSEKSSEDKLTSWLKI